MKDEPESQEKTAFATPSGLYKFKVVPFGLCNSLATFQGLMECVLAGITRKECMVYVDDLIVGDPLDFQGSNLQNVFQQLREAGLRLKPCKCLLGGNRVLYLGFMVFRERISPDPAKAEAVNAFTRPQDVKVLRSFLGLALLSKIYSGIFQSG